jgi:hypothetical protein
MMAENWCVKNYSIAIGFLIGNFSANRCGKRRVLVAVLQHDKIRILHASFTKIVHFISLLHLDGATRLCLA